MNAKLKYGIIKFCKSKITISAAILILLYTLCGFFLLPYLIERYLPRTLSQRLNSQVSLQQVKTNPFRLSLEAREFRIDEPSGRPMTGFRRLYINFQLSSLFRWALTFAEVTLDAPSINMVIDPDGKLNLIRLAGQPTTAAENPPAEAEEKTNRPLRMLLHHIQINQGKIAVTDARQSIPAKVSFFPLNIQATDISTLAEREGPYSLTATSGDGAVLQWSGRVSLQPLWSEGRLEFKQIPLANPWEFVRSQLNISPPEGHLNFVTRYLIDLGQDKRIITLDDLGVRVRDVGIRLEDSEEALLNLPEINLNAGKLDLIQHKIDDVRLSIQNGDLNLVKDESGSLNMQQLINSEKTPMPSSSETKPDSENPWTVDISQVNLEGLALHYKDQSTEPAVSLSTDSINLVFKAAVTTPSPKAQVKIEDLGLTLQQIALGFRDSPQPALRINNLTMAGGFDLGARKAAISRLELTDGLVNVIRNNDNTINLTQLFETTNPKPGPSDQDPQAEKSQPWQYAVETLSLSEFKTRFIDMSLNSDKPVVDLEKINLNVSRFDGKSPSPFEMGFSVAQGGELNISGKFYPSGNGLESSIVVKDMALPTFQPYLAQIADLTLNSGLLSTKGTLHRAVKGDLTYKGQVGIADLQVIENHTNETLVGWQQLEAPKFRLNLKPNGLEIDTIKLSRLEGKLLISEDKKVNVVEAFKSKDQPSTKPQPKESVPDTSGISFPVRINRLTLDNGLLDFSDLSLRPQFATKIHELEGVIIGISSSEGARTQVELDGRVDEFGTSKIKGEINTFDPEQFTDIAMIFRNLEMTNLTPYSGKFAGRKIDSGKLSLDLLYKIDNRQLLGENKIVIDSLKLGEKVESPDAINLPLDLAVALLKNSDGIIDIGLPVSGNLDDPEFRYGSLIWKALVNLLTKIVTAPFRALGALFGGGEEVLNAVFFEPGSRDVPPPEQEKLAKLLKALKQRPQLKLIVTGRYDSPADGQAIKQLRVRRALAEASGLALKPGEDPGPVDFSNPDSQKKLAGLFIARYGQEAYKELQAKITPSGKSDDSKDDSKKKPKDPGELAKLLFAELMKREPMDPGLLKQLADDRAQVIVSLLTTTDGIPPERIKIQPSESMEEGDKISATLGLDAM